MPHVPIQQAFDLAVRHHQAGRLAEAERIYRQILARQPSLVEAIHLLGVIAHQTGRTDLAVDLIRRAIALRPNFIEAQYNLGIVLKDMGQLDEAIAACRLAIDLKPDYAEAHANLGAALRDRGQVDEAIAACRRAIALKPGCAKAHNSLGVALKDKGRLDEAIAAYRQAILLRPDLAEAHNNLGVVLRDKGQLDDAVAAYRRAIVIDPNYPQAHSNLGNALKDKGDLDEAIIAYRRAIELNPAYANAHYNLGAAQIERAQFDQAIAAHRRAVALRPDFAEAHNNLGVALNGKGRLDEALAAHGRAIALRPDFAEAYNSLGVALNGKSQLDEAAAAHRQAIVLRPDFAQAHNNLGVALKGMGQLDEAVAAHRQAIALRPDFAEAHSNLLLTLQYCTGVTAAALAEAHAQYDRRHAAQLFGAPASHANVRQAHRRLRVGFVSPDLGQHPVGQFLVPVLENICRDQLETICYSNRLDKDPVAHRLAAAATQWRDVAGLTDPQLAGQIRCDRIDILFDLAGHTAGNRLLTFARKPAPLQITWLGYVGTTGLRAMDYILADRRLIPPEAEPHYCEKVLRMPDDYVCYGPPADSPAPGPLPAGRRGYITFGSFNNPSKITPQVVETWAKILHRVPRSRLILRYSGLEDGGAQRRFNGLFAHHAIARDRLDLVGWSPFATRLDLYRQIDIALDPFPYSGATTTCDALWMGIPVIALPGETFAGRQSLTHLLAVGLHELVARDLSDYVDRAAALAGDFSRLAAMRAGLRQRMLRSPLMDAPNFARNLEKICREIWLSSRQIVPDNEG